MMAAYKLRSRDLLADADKTEQLMAKGTLAPAEEQQRAEVREVFRRSAEEEKE
jgi:hypothetical protein